jgi:N-acetylglucosamine-6-phosphate deacetylase
MTVLSSARVVCADGVLEPGWLRVEGDRIAEVSAGEPPPGAELLDGWLLPGFVDIHVHGGGGASYTAGDAAQARAAAAFHLQYGTTTTLASLVTAPAAELLAVVRVLADLVDEGVLAGLHLEGPFLAAARCGAHDPALLLEPSVDLLDELLRAGRDTIRMVTVAPELPGGLELIKRLAGAGVVAAVGHSDAGYDDAREAFAAGATVATHLYNGMPPMHHREPGVVGAALSHDGVVVELINDGVHLHPAVVAGTFAQVGSTRVALVTDAMSAAGVGDGEYVLGGQQVRVVDGVARVVGSASIAGSTLTMDTALRAAVAAGVPMVDAVRAASDTPARAVGLAEVGMIAPGKLADLVVLDDGLAVRRVMRRGQWVR